MIELNKRGDATQVIEVATSQLTEHSKQADYSPEMSKKKWAEFVAGIAKEGILQPLVITPGFRVIDGKHRRKAAQELGIENVRVIIEDIPEDDIPNYIAQTKLNRDDLKPGQKAAIVIRLYYEGERQKAKERMSDGGKGGINEGVPNSVHLDKKEGKTNEILAKKAGIGKSNMTSLLAVYRNRSDLFEKVFEGSYSINKAYTEMKRDEHPDEEVPEKPTQSKAREIVEEAVEKESTLPQFKESEPETSPSNKLISTRKTALSTAVNISYDSELLKQEKDEEVKDGYLEQLKALAKTCIIALGENAKSDDDAGIAYLCLELLNKINGGKEDE